MWAIYSEILATTELNIKLFLPGLFHAIIRPMDPKQRLIKFLDEEVLPAEKTESRETLAAYIVGELVGDCDNVYEKLLENDSRVQRISDLAIDLEWSNGYDELDLQDMWRELKNLIEELKNEWFLVLGFCRNYVNLVADTKYKGQDILENKLYYYKKRVMRGIRL